MMASLGNKKNVKIFFLCIGGGVYCFYCRNGVDVHGRYSQCGPDIQYRSG